MPYTIARCYCIGNGTIRNQIQEIKVNIRGQRAFIQAALDNSADRTAGTVLKDQLRFMA